MVRALKPLGKKAMLHAYLTGHTDAPRGTAVSGGAKWRHRLGNLHDSFASAVYVNGVVVKTSIQYLDNPISKGVDERTKKNGRATVNDYLKRVSFGKKNNEVVLVVVAAMFYTRILENTSSRMSGRYVVITPARNFIDSQWHSYVSPVYAKYGLKNKPKTRVIRGEIKT